MAPSLPAGWNGFALRRLRVGRSLLDLELRRRPEAVVLRVAHLFGPRMVLTASLGGRWWTPPRWTVSRCRRVGRGSRRTTATKYGFICAASLARACLLNASGVVRFLTSPRTSMSRFRRTLLCLGLLAAASCRIEDHTPTGSRHDEEAVQGS